jgi:hypothetical protein
MDPHFIIQQILAKSPLPVPEALALVLRLAPGKIDLYEFNRLPIFGKRAKLTRALKDLSKTAPSQMPVVLIAQQVLPKKRSVEQMLAAEFGSLAFARLPDTLKLLVIRRYECKRLAVQAHAEMQAAEDTDTRLAAALECTRLMKENWEIWNELHHYHRTGQVLGKREEFKIENFEDKVRRIEREQAPLAAAKELLGMLRTAANRIYKLRKDPDNAELCAKWISKYNFVAKRINEPTWIEK